MNQLSWLPEKIVHVEANPVPSADSPGIGVARSHQRYVLKVAHSGHPHLPASEWASHALAFALGLPVPHWVTIQAPHAGREPRHVRRMRTWPAHARAPRMERSAWPTRLA